MLTDSKKERININSTMEYTSIKSQERPSVRTCGIAQDRRIAGSRNVDRQTRQSSTCDKALVIMSLRHCTALTEFSSNFKS